MPKDLIKLSAQQIDSLPRDKTVFFFAVGPLEDHGPHLPIGLDLEESSRLCSITAQHLEEEMPGWHGVLMPKAALGINCNTSKLAITVRSHVLRDYLVDSCQSLVKVGFYHFVCFTGHLGPRQLTAIEEAGRIVNRLGGVRNWFNKIIFSHPVPTLISASSPMVTFKHVLASPFWPDPEEHGGQRDTSVALAIFPELVDPQFRELPIQIREEFCWARTWARLRGKISSYWGNPSQASVEKGENEIFGTLERVFPKMQAVWEKASSWTQFKTWYSILPPNKSFFKAWLLILFSLIVWISWMYLHFLSIETNF